MSYSNDGSDWRSSIRIIIGLLALFVLGIVLAIVYNAWVPYATNSVDIPQANASVTLYHYRNLLPVDGKYVRVRQRGKTLTGHTFNPDWVHYPRLNVYLTPSGNIGIIGPYDDQGQIFDLAVLKLRYAETREADAWTYLGVFTHDSKKTGFLPASDRVECLYTLEQLTDRHARPDARTGRCD